MDNSGSYETWHTDAGKEAAMEGGHRPLWRHFIETVPENDLSTKAVLDFGCNRGGFLRLLFALKPFRRGLGVDIARDSVAAARALAGTVPVDYEVATDLSPWQGQFDLAFSYEVIYLLPELATHAAQMWQALRPGGTYYAVTGCHTDCPMWPRWRTVISGMSNAPVQDRSISDYAEAFAVAGFDVSLRRFGYNGFTPVPRDRTYYQNPMEALDYASEHKILFRMVKPA
jgi:SAM-dependent methyltransferase